MALDFVYTSDWMDLFTWTIYVGFTLCFLSAFGMGANDTANSYGTVVGAGVLKLWQAYILATICEVAGAMLLGYRVTETIRSGIVDLNIYTVDAYPNGSLLGNCSDPSANCTSYSSAELLLGELGALGGTAFWLIAASLFKMPVSATQSVVGATVGFSLVLKGSKGIHWMSLVKIAVSWVTSPLLAGLFSVGFFYVIKLSVFEREDQLTSSLRTLPLWFCFTLAINCFTVFFRGSKYLGLDTMSWWLAAIISISIGVISALFMWFVGNKWVEHRAVNIKKKSIAESPVKSGEAADAMLEEVEIEDTVSPLPDIHDLQRHPSRTRKISEMSFKDMYEAVVVEHPAEDTAAVHVFDYLQILSACFLAFSHGSNDTANSVGPLVALFLSWKYGSATIEATENPAMQLIILFGAASSMVGLWVLGHRVIKTIGKDLTQVNAPSGFAMSLGTASTVLFASKVGIPVSTTHCMVGAVVLVGLARSDRKGVSWKLFRNIAFAWLVTTPVAGLVSAALTYLLAHFVLGVI